MTPNPNPYGELAPVDPAPDPAVAWPHAGELGDLQTELQAYVAAVSGDPTSAADIVQEANMIIWQKRDEFVQEKEGDFRAWAFRIAYFKALAHRRDKARQGWLVFSDEVMLEIAGTAEIMVRKQSQRMEALQICLTKLNPGQRHLLKRVYGEGLTVPEYATEINASPAAIYKTLQRLRKTLRDCIVRTLNISS